MTREVQSIAIVANPWYRHFFANLCARLKRQFGARVHVYSVSQAGCDLFRSVDVGGAFDSFHVAPHPTTYTPGQQLDRDAVVSRARYFEERYGVTYNYLMVPDRLFGRGYAPGGYYHPRTRQSEQGTYLDALNIYNQQFEFWERQFEERDISMILEVNSPLHAVVARKFGAVVRNPTPSRHKNYYYWTTDEFGYTSRVEELFNSDVELPLDEALSGVAYQSALFNKEAVRRFQLPGVLCEIAAHTKNHVQWKLSGHHKGKLYRYRDQVELALRRRREYRKLVAVDTTRLADLSGRRFVFYALHVEPELWFQGRSPEFFHQLSAIASLSRDLPADVTLAVKEHLPGIGRRPDLFYAQIRDLKNTVIMSINEPGQEIVRAADAVATISGTVGQEAAVLGKPVITFGRHNLYNTLPHVRLVQREEDLGPALRFALSGEVDDQAARRAGLRFLAAIGQISFDMKAFTARTPDGFDEQSISAAYQQLLASLPQSGQPENLQAAESVG